VSGVFVRPGVSILKVEGCLELLKMGLLEGSLGS